VVSSNTILDLFFFYIPFSFAYFAHLLNVLSEGRALKRGTTVVFSGNLTSNSPLEKS
jgi:hypothetical protein